MPAAKCTTAEETQGLAQVLQKSSNREQLLLVAAAIVGGGVVAYVAGYALEKANK